MVTEERVSRGDIFLVALNPTRGSEIRKARPCVIVAPLTTGGHPYPFRVRSKLDGKDGYVVADQLRAVDKERLVRRLGSLSETTLTELLGVLQAMFAV
jgi:mRNA interferase MazF